MGSTAGRLEVGGDSWGWWKRTLLEEHAIVHWSRITGDLKLKAEPFFVVRELTLATGYVPKPPPKNVREGIYTPYLGTRHRRLRPQSGFFIQFALFRVMNQSVLL